MTTGAKRNQDIDSRTQRDIKSAQPLLLDLWVTSGYFAAEKGRTQFKVCRRVCRQSWRLTFLPVFKYQTAVKRQRRKSGVPTPPGYGCGKYIVPVKLTPVMYQILNRVRFERNLGRW